MFKAYNKLTSNPVAVKQILKRKICKEVREQIDLEIDLLRLLSEEPHPNIIQVFDVYEDTQKIIIVMEYVEAGHMY